MISILRIPRLMLLATLVVIVVCCGLHIPRASAATGINNNIELTGYMWSSTVGWISLNCKTGGSSGNNICGTGAASSTYRVIINTAGNMYGYAWSSTVGWIRFGGLSAFPIGGGTTAANANVDGAYPVLTFDGWARACAGTTSAPGSCGTMTSRTDGWDGWISLKGTGYNLTTASGGGMATLGYFWGGENVGWVGSTASMKWNNLTAVLSGNPCTIARGASTCSTSVDWTLTPANMFNPIVEQTTPANVTTKINGTSVTGSKAVNLSFGDTVYTAKSDTLVLNTLTLNTICTNPEDTIVAGVCNFNTALPVAVTLNISNKFVRSGGSVDVGWVITGMADQTGCTLTGPKISANPVNSLIGTTTVSGLKSYSSYTLTCTRTGGSDSATANVEVIPTVTEN